MMMMIRVLLNCNGILDSHSRCIFLLWPLYQPATLEMTETRCSKYNNKLEERKSMEFNFQFPYECETLISFLQHTTTSEAMHEIRIYVVQRL